MKALENVKIQASADGKSITMTADITDKTYSLILARRVTIGYIHPQNMRHVRHVQLSNEAIFVKAFGQVFAFDFEDVIAMANVVNPKTSFAPVVINSKDSLSVSIVSELAFILQWQAANVVIVTQKTAWTDISGQTAATLDVASVPKSESTIPVWVRCVATNGAGTSYGLQMMVK